jgi:PPK2 family polyphosphate:nucleotide phosphotransferase
MDAAMSLSYKEVQRLFRVSPQQKVRLRDHDPAWAAKEEFQELKRKELKARAVDYLARSCEALAEAQENLYAADCHSVLIVLQAMDAAGKDGTIKHVMSGVNPQGCQVFSFKKPSAEELDHNFLWRYMKALPERGRIGIFNRSYYEDVLVVRVHPELLGGQRLPGAKDSKAFWEDRYDDINRFERHLVRNGTLILKFFLNVSKKAQRERFAERLEDPSKHWKFSFSDLEERRHWDAYQDAFEQMLGQTSTKWAPWWVVPADNKWVTRALVAGIVTEGIKGLGDRPPEVSAEQGRRLAQARRELGLTGKKEEVPTKKEKKQKGKKEKSKKKE